MQRRTAALVVACAGGYLAFLDTSIVNTAFPDVQASFDDAGRAELSWVLDAYFIVLAALLVPAGALADRLGRKRVFLWGVGAFVLTSIACGLAPSWETLVAARVLQGAAAAVIAPVSLALVLPEFAREQRATAVGIWGAAAAFAAATGPPLGGLVVEVADWRWIFLVNVPLGGLVLLAGARALRESKDEAMAGLPDLAGAGLSVLGLGLLALGIVEGESWGWTSAGVLGSLGGALVALAAVARRCTTHPRPVVDPALMAIRSFRVANVGTLLFAAAFFSTILGNILFLTSVWGYSVLDAGLATVPGPLVSAIVAGPAGRLADRVGHRAVIVPGTIAYAAGLLVLRSAGAEPDYVGTWLPGMLLVGVGIGLAFPTLGAAAVADVEPDRFGAASAVASAFRQIGAVLGTAILVAIVGDPRSLAEALAHADDAYAFAVAASLASGVVALLLRPAPAGRAPAAAPAPA
ncbi:MFS transporter [Conexibacter sp. SYSU D00693]|uniref:MFS transporter n=1 Tax=Conexibacter sp. SYSU D00693 TaxID=2812560 RepID=UPI00196A8352|nr:MFS transporter [Conexibacter sp. SYSU D00693]